MKSDAANLSDRACTWNCILENCLKLVLGPGRDCGIDFILNDTKCVDLRAESRSSSPRKLKSSLGFDHIPTALQFPDLESF
jgi:hypothetical protein